MAKYCFSLAISNGGAGKELPGPVVKSRRRVLHCDIDVTSRKTRVTFYRRPSATVCFRRVSRRKEVSK